LDSGLVSIAGVARGEFHLMPTLCVAFRPRQDEMRQPGASLRIELKHYSRRGLLIAFNTVTQSGCRKSNVQLDHTQQYVDTDRVPGCA
jgi:hypothetical protein